MTSDPGLLKQEILTALSSGSDHAALLELVRRKEAQGLTPRESYNVLEGIWRDFGFADTEEGGPLRGELEFVMERVWFQG